MIAVCSHDRVTICISFMKEHGLIELGQMFVYIVADFRCQSRPNLEGSR